MQSITTLVDVGNGQKAYETLIGWVTVTEPFRKRTSEQTACNWREIEVKPGVYDVVQTKFHDVSVRYEGDVVDEYFVNRLFHASSIAPKGELPRPAYGAAYGRLYDYEAARRFATDPDWELAVDYKVEMSTWHSEHDGTPRKRFRFVKPEGAA